MKEENDFDFDYLYFCLTGEHEIYPCIYTLHLPLWHKTRHIWHRNFENAPYLHLKWNFYIYGSRKNLVKKAWKSKIKVIILTYRSTWNEVSRSLVDHQQYHSEVLGKRHLKRSWQSQIQVQTTCYLMPQSPSTLSTAYRPRRQRTLVVPDMIESFVGKWIVDLSDPLYTIKSGWL